MSHDRIRRSPRIRLAVALAACCAIGFTSAPTAAGTTTFAIADPVVITGTLSSGATFEARVPAEWNGTLVLYAHGFRGPGPNPAWDARNDPTFNALMERGYAVAASSYATTGWSLGTAVDDQLETLARFGSDYQAPDRTIAYGRSMGGLITSLIAETPRSGVDGAVSTCGLVGGGVALNNYQLDAAHAVAELLLGDPDLQLTGFRSRDESALTANAIAGALTEAQQTPEGRARIALVAALLNTPTDLDGVDPDDPVAMQAAQYPLVLATLPEVINRRSDIVVAADGDSGWTAGVDYRRLVLASPQLERVRALYSAAGLDLGADLRTLTGNADIRPDVQALRWMNRTSQPTGRLRMPVLATHTLVDILAPVEYQEEYAEMTRQADRERLFRQAFVDRDGHCNFTAAENVAAIQVMDFRLDNGRWGGQAEVDELQERAEDLGLDGAAFVRYRPGEFVNDRVWRR
jgi:hypothetical protein